jgi:hypothetical protein
LSSNLLLSFWVLLFLQDSQPSFYKFITWLQVPANSFYLIWQFSVTQFFILMLIILDKQNKLLSSLLCIVLQFPVTSSLLGPNSFLNTVVSDFLNRAYALSLGRETKF